jgi:hypothetical protein
MRVTLCLVQDLVLQFFRDMFSFQEVRFTTVEDLAQDILLKAREASLKAWDRLCPDQLSDSLNDSVTQLHDSMTQLQDTFVVPTINIGQGDSSLNNGLVHSSSSEHLAL